MKKLLFTLIFISFSLSGNEVIWHDHTLTYNSFEDLKEQHKVECEKRSGSISFVHAQDGRYLLFHLITRCLQQTFHPGRQTESELRNWVFLRYPDEKAPKSLQALFKKFPIIDGYDTDNSEVNRLLVSASPSLDEKQGSESALDIARFPRTWLLDENITIPFEEEHLLRSFYESELSALMKAFQNEYGKTAILTQVFLPKDAPLHRSIYLSQEYGIPWGWKTHGQLVSIVDFYQTYQSLSSKERSKTNYQIRFLPSSLTEENGFDSSTIEMVRYVSLTEEQLEVLREQVQGFVSRLKRKEEKLLRFIQGIERKLKEDSSINQELLEKYVELQLKRAYPEKALPWIKMLSDKNGKEKWLTVSAFVALSRGNYALSEEILKEQSDPLLREYIVISQAFFFAKARETERIIGCLEALPSSDRKNGLLALLSLFGLVDHSLDPNFQTDFPKDLEPFMQTVSMMIYPTFILEEKKFGEIIKF